MNAPRLAALLLAVVSPWVNPPPTWAQVAPRQTPPLPTRYPTPEAAPAPLVLTPRLAFALAVIRSRSPEAFRLLPTDPAKIEAEADRLGFGDFDRFRRELVAPVDTAKFRDPSASILDLTAQAAGLAFSGRTISKWQELRDKLEELVGTEVSNLNLLVLDEVDDAMQRLRALRLARIIRYQASLDGLKLELGLPPEVSIAIDPRSFAPYLEVFDSFGTWRDGPRDLDKLEPLARGIPRLALLRVGDRSLDDVVQSGDARALDALLAGGARLVRDRRAPGSNDPNDDARVARVRSTIRSLVENRLNWSTSRRRLVLVARIEDRLIEASIAPPPSSTESKPKFRPMIDLYRNAPRFEEVETSLVDRWATDQRLQLDLARDLGSLPDADWPAFLARVVLPPAGSGVSTPFDLDR